MERSQVKHIEKIKSSKDNAIVSILKKGPKSTSEIQKQLRLKFDFNIPRENLKKEYLLGRLSNKITFENRKYYLKKEYEFKDSNSSKIQLINNPKKMYSRTSIEEIVKEYYAIHNRLKPLVKETLNYRKKNKPKIDNLKYELNIILNQIIDFIINNNYSLSELQTFCDQILYHQITSNSKIKSFIQEKSKKKIIIFDNNEDKLNEYEILCEIAWDDGIITPEEEIELINKVEELNLDPKIANEIFEKVKGEYFAKQKAINQPKNYDVIKINNSKFIIKKAKLPFQPIFTYEFNNQNGEEYITINLAHDLYKKESEELIINMACSVYFTKQSMTSSEISIFIDRFHQNLKLIE